ncbi:DUF4163 domain-containing protein [Lacinutrix neustonica]|uniref:DUF4163 domain-containing protein n=1 Tax=Lacinutrix neustonica TaxID=2980107 RepID=A0A9E8MSY2_9FLAO|nr:DUF4163 domain-containing protein [Lacinutrix neustonica]WAC00868.1 DUF4163 domain-containing protein [Lacinutrix neustonica]
MFNTAPFRFLKIFGFILFVTVLYSCDKEVPLKFTETQIIDRDETTIEINIPKAEGHSEAAKQINSALSQFVNSVLNIENSYPINVDTKKSIAGFKKSYANFKTQMGNKLYTNLPVWEVIIDGEILYTNKTLISMAMTSGVNTGAAHGNLVFEFYNFDIKTGKQLTTKNLINDVQAFTILAKKYYDKELLSANESRISAFEAKAFEIP